MNEPFFSVIIPVLNEEKFLPRLLKNLERQTERDFEIIIVDGGSKDKTLAVCRGFEKNLGLKILVSSKQNVSAQRNFGAESSHGTYLVFFDADVQVPKEFLKEVRQHIEKYHPPYVTTLLKADSSAVYDEAIVKLLNLTMEMSQTFERPFMGGYNFIIARGIFDLIGGFHEEVVHAEDYDLSTRLHKAGYRMTILKEPQLIFSLRRFRHEGRLAVLRKNAKATLHVLTRGAITHEIFSYPMGGSIYHLKKREQIKPAVLAQVEQKTKQFLKLFLE